MPTHTPSERAKRRTTVGTKVSIGKRPTASGGKAPIATVTRKKKPRRAARRRRGPVFE